MKPQTVRNELFTFSAILREARKAGLVDHNPLEGVKLPKVEKADLRCLEADEENRILANASEPRASAIVISLHSGLREQELATLTWPDVKADEGVLVVQAPRAKSRKARRIPINETLGATLAALQKYAHSKYVVTNPRRGERYDRFNNTAWRNTLKTAGVKGLRWHDLRATFATRLHRKGVPTRTIQYLLGHASLETTEKYLRISPEDSKLAVGTLDGPGSFHEALNRGEQLRQELHMDGGKRLTAPQKMVGSISR